MEKALLRFESFQSGFANDRFWADAKLCLLDRMAQDQPTDLMLLSGAMP